MAFELPPLPYAKNALEPHISAKTLEFHHDKHHRAYVDTLNKLVANTPFAGKSLEEIIRLTAKDSSQATIFNNAAQAWNHEFFWHSMKPKGGGKPAGALAQQIERDLGGVTKFEEDFVKAGVSQFGSGWVWLALDRGKLKIVKTADAVDPLILGLVPLLTCDVWEHAYYLDYQNRREDFLKTFFDHLANWDFAAENLAKLARERAQPGPLPHVA
jgi:superoxide dismutase, Fe-Mn family